MEFDELQELAKAQAEVNDEMRFYQKEISRHQPVEPIEAKLTPHYDLEKISGRLKDITQNMSGYHSEYNLYTSNLQPAKGSDFEG